MEGLEITVFTDGASRGNPGEAGVGLVFFDRDGKELLRKGRYIGQSTNNVAEYTALLVALEEAARLGASRLRVFSDSELMIKQLRGEYQVKNESLQPLHQAALSQAASFDSVSYTHVPRERNKIADRLANEAIDDKVTD